MNCTKKNSFRLFFEFNMILQHGHTSVKPMEKFATKGTVMVEEIYSKTNIIFSFDFNCVML